MNSTPKKTVLVTGASGYVGRRAVELLLDASGCRVIAGTRTLEKPADLHTRGAEIRQVNFDEPLGMEESFKGVDSLLIVSTDAIAEPGRRLRQHNAAIEAAANAGIKHVVYTSFARSEANAPITICADHYGTEQTLRASGLAYTALRNNLYAESIIRRVPTILARGEVVGLSGGGGIAYITREDCARVAAAVVASDQAPIGEIEVTGPEIINDEQLTLLISEITGKHVRFTGVTADALLSDLIAGGMPEARAKFKVSFDTAIASGYLGFTTDNVAQLTGQPPIHVRDFLVSAGIARMAG